MMPSKIKQCEFMKAGLVTATRDYEMMDCMSLKDGEDGVNEEW